jgi:hypothetical protein
MEGYLWLEMGMARTEIRLAQMRQMEAHQPLTLTRPVGTAQPVN